MLRKKIEFESSKSKTEIIETINKLLLLDYGNGYVYNRKDYDFVIARSTLPFVNSFKPVFCGKIYEEANTTRIRLTIKMSSIVETILIILITIALISFIQKLVFLGFSYFQLTSFPLYALLMVLIGIVIFHLSVNPQLKILKGRLS